MQKNDLLLTFDVFSSCLVKLSSVILAPGSLVWFLRTQQDAAGSTDDAPSLLLPLIGTDEMDSGSLGGTNTCCKIIMVR